MRRSDAAHQVGVLTVDVRQGMPLTNRAPLEYEHEVAVLRHVAVEGVPQVDGVQREALDVIVDFCDRTSRS